MNSRMGDESLFGIEQEVLRTAAEDLGNSQYRDNGLLPRYRTLVNQYRKLLKITRKVFRISDTQGRVLQQQQHEMQTLLDNANQGFLTFGRELKVNRQYSAECVRIFGKKIGGLSIVELFTGSCDPAELTELWLAFFSAGDEEGGDLLSQIPSVIHINQKTILLECKPIMLSNDGRTQQKSVMLLLTDVSDKLRAEEQIRYLSYHDELTSLYNRSYVEKLRPELEKERSSLLSVILVDMNGLKLVNDVFGHREGDQLLIAMARILQQVCRAGATIVRWGGDEFLVILPETDNAGCEELCRSIREACAAKGDTPIPLSAAMGMATRDPGCYASLSELFSAAENRMYSNKLLESRQVRKTIIAGMEDILHTRCFEDAGHGARTYQQGIAFAAYLGLDMEHPDIKPLVLLAALHDIGKVAIPRDILGKKGPLSPGEWEIVKSHSDIGYRMAQSIGEGALADVILALHERWDGTGYPYSCKGDKIPFLSRLFSLVDVYDTLTHARPYGPVMTRQAALEELLASSGSQFDPRLTPQFVEFIKNRNL